MGGRANHVHYLHFAMRAKTGRSSATMRPQRTPMPRRETNPRRGHDTTTLPAEYDCPSRAQIKRGNKLNVELNSGLLSMFTFHPLSLMLPADLDDSKFLTQLTEMFTRQRLVMISAICSPVWTCSMSILLPQMHSRIKWNLTSVCLLRSWKTGFLLRARADWLSILSMNGVHRSLFSSVSSRASQTP
jgi:hypothetical protein